MNKVLFIGTYDSYRSKFAALYFNSVCKAANLRSRAFSVGFEISPNKRRMQANPALDYLGYLGIITEMDELRPTAINEVYLESCNRRICMNMEEHLTMMRKRFPTYVRHCDYWHFRHDDHNTLINSLPLIQKEVDHLIASLKVEGAGV